MNSPRTSNSLSSAVNDTPLKSNRMRNGAQMAARVLELAEENPMSGTRGARLLLMRPDVLRGQVRAIRWSSDGTRRPTSSSRDEQAMGHAGRSGLTEEE